MSLYLLVEGEITEKQVYRAWLHHELPWLREVGSAPEITTGAFYVLSSGGYPTPGLLEACARDVRDNPAIEHLVVCVDTDDRPAATVREQQVTERLAEAIDATRMREGNPNVRAHVIVQHWCIETWFLGNARLALRASPSERLVKLLGHFDVRAHDPEAMGLPSWSERDTPRTISKFHQQYLRELFLNVEPRARYSKSAPGIVLDRAYYDALRERVATTGHLPSLARLFEAWQQVRRP